MGTKNVSGVRKVMRGGRPRWFIDFRFTDKEGVRRRFRRDASVQSYSAALAEADRLMKRAAATGSVEEAETEASTEHRAMTYSDFVSGYFERLYMPKFRPATARRYRELHRQRVLAFWGNSPLAEIGPSDFRAFAALLHEARVQTKGPITLVRTVLRAAHESGCLDEMPAIPTGLISVSRKVPSAPSSDEVDVMLGAPGWLGLAIALAALAGMRMGEVRALEVRDIEIEQHHIVIRRALSEDQSLTPKSGAERKVPMSVELERRLREVVKDKLPRARVVLDANGLTPSRQAVLRLFKKYLRGAGIKERSFHALRHYFISELMRGGASAEAVRVLAGHSKLEMTQRYAHVVTADLRAAIDRLGK